MASLSTSGITEEDWGPAKAAVGGASSSSNNSGTSNGSTNGNRDASSTNKRKRATMGKGRWTKQENSDFLDGLERFGEQCRAIAKLVKTRTTVQTKVHHAKYVKLLRQREREQVNK